VNLGKLTWCSLSSRRILDGLPSVLPVVYPLEAHLTLVVGRTEARAEEGVHGLGDHALPTIAATGGRALPPPRSPSSGHCCNPQAQIWDIQSFLPPSLPGPPAAIIGVAVDVLLLARSVGHRRCRFRGIQTSLCPIGTREPSRTPSLLIALLPSTSAAELAFCAAAPGGAAG
jgi:hypothetical protein